MITNIALTTVWVTDFDAAKQFYTETLGFVLVDDATMGDFRWVTVAHPDHPELEITFSKAGAPPSPDYVSEAVSRALAEKRMHGFGVRVDDCRATADELKAKGVEFTQDPTDRPYGVEAVFLDNQGNWIVMVERPDGPTGVDAI